MRKVLLTEPIQPIGMELLQRGFTITIAPDPKPETIRRMIKGFHGLIARNTIIDESIFAEGDCLQVVAAHGAGVDHIDVKAASAYRVLVVNTPGANSLSVAEAVVGLMLAVSRKIVEGDYALRMEKDFYHRDKCIGVGLTGKKLLIIGMGEIGKKLSDICTKGFGMSVYGYDPYVSAEELSLYKVSKITNIDDAIGEMDYISLNCPYSVESHHMINADRMMKMKSSAYLINCARGSLIDEEALYFALKNNVIAGAALDVFQEEPPRYDSPIFTLSNVVVTPHIAAFAKESIDNMSMISAEDIIYVLKGDPDKAHIVNKEIL